MSTMNGCSFLFFDDNQTHRMKKAQSTRPQTGISSMCTCVRIFCELWFLK